MNQFDINAVVSNVLKDYVQCPTHEALKEELGKHEYVMLKHWIINDPLGRNQFGNQHRDATSWYKIKHICLDCVIVEDVLLVAGKTRFDTHVVALNEWETVFGEWITKDHEVYSDCNYEYVNGIRGWGADV